MLRFLFIFCLYLAFVIAFQWIGGAYSSELGGHPDEPSHYVTGLMVRDYLESSDWQHPGKFAAEFYAHYPKVAIGHWPPLFYSIEAIWMLLFSSSRASVMIMMALLTSALAYIIQITASKYFDRTLGFACGLSIIPLPLIHAFSKMVMTEILVSILVFCAALSLIRFLETQKWHFSLIFGFSAALAILSKGTAVALALLPLIALILMRKYRMIKSISFWIAPIVVILLCAPFYISTLQMVQNGWVYSTPDIHFTLRAIPYYFHALFHCVVPVSAIFILIGLFYYLFIPYVKNRTEARWCVLAALPVSVLLFHFFIPCGFERRHLIVAIPALMILMAAGINVIVNKLNKIFPWLFAKTTIIVIILGITVLSSIPNWQRKSWDGFGRAAQELLSLPQFANSIFLISSDPTGEGIFISEVAMREIRPGHIVLRGSKVLSQSKWGGANHRVLFDNPAQLMEFLDSQPVGLVLLDNSVPVEDQLPEHELLSSTIAGFSDKWERIFSFNVIRNSAFSQGGIVVYRLRGHEQRPIRPIVIDMEKMLGRKIVLSPGS
ncbi:MAG: glycosyltransferase family 39 protein [Acidobacteria bacterium]|nr:glycosyltransferase family 39 protein [Acidobacteriota bacterium]